MNIHAEKHRECLRRGDIYVCPHMVTPIPVSLIRENETKVLYNLDVSSEGPVNNSVNEIEFFEEVVFKDLVTTGSHHMGAVDG